MDTTLAPSLAREPVEALRDEIARLKRERNALILAHNYQVLDVKAVADALGDSYALAAIAQKADCDWIVFCGVRFMAETAKLLNPAKRVVLPESMAGCDLAASIDAEGLRRMKAKHPGARTVMYINCNIDVKAEADAICTSANALKVVDAMDSDTVIFGPDKNLAAWVARRSGKNIVAWHGYCPIHERMDVATLEATVQRHPEAYVILHPECPGEVHGMADAILSTSRMLEQVPKVDAKEFIIGTELGLIEELQQRFPDRTFHPAYRHKSCDESCACPYMKMTQLESVVRSLRTGREEITVPERYREPAMRAVQRMLEIGT